jgi:hypothetical protein
VNVDKAPPSGAADHPTKPRLRQLAGALIVGSAGAGLLAAADRAGGDGSFARVLEGAALVAPRVVVASAPSVPVSTTEMP